MHLQVMFTIIYFAFAIMGMSMFGSNVHDFSSLGLAMQAVSQMIMGETFFEAQQLRFLFSPAALPGTLCV